MNDVVKQNLLNDCFVADNEGHNITKTKFCNGCKTEKDLSDFGFRKTENRYESKCKECKRIDAKERMRKKRAKAKKVKANKDKRLSDSTKIDFTEFEEEIHMDDQINSRRRELKFKIGEIVCQLKKNKEELVM